MGVIFPNDGITDEAVKQRAQQVAERQARAELEAERRQAEAAREVAWAQRIQRLQNAEAEARRQLSGLRPSTFKDVEPAIAAEVARFWNAFSAFKARLTEIQNTVLQHWSGMDGGERERRWATLLQEAGLSGYGVTGIAQAHDEASRVARTVIGGLLDGNIQPGSIWANGQGDLKK